MGTEYQPEDDQDLRKIIKVLDLEYANLRSVWQAFLELYARDSARIDRMNAVAPRFFGMVDIPRSTTTSERGLLTIGGTHYHTPQKRS